MNKYIGYIRVSTKEQDNSGLGQSAQKTMIRNFLKSDDHLITEVTVAQLLFLENNH